MRRSWQAGTTNPRLRIKDNFAPQKLSVEPWKRGGFRPDEPSESQPNILDRKNLWNISGGDSFTVSDLKLRRHFLPDSGDYSAELVPFIEVLRRRKGCRIKVQTLISSFVQLVDQCLWIRTDIKGLDGDWLSFLPAHSAHGVVSSALQVLHSLTAQKREVNIRWCLKWSSAMLNSETNWDTMLS